MTKVYVVEHDLGYDGIWTCDIFSSKKNAIKYIEEEYPKAKYYEEENRWVIHYYNEDLEHKIWDGDLIISEYVLDAGVSND